MAIPPTTDQGKRAWLREGKELIFSAAPTKGVETPKEKAARTIQAAWLEELALPPGRVVTVSITISNAVIEGQLNLKAATFKDEVSIINSEFTSLVDFSFCSFERNLTLSKGLFREAINCDSAVARYRVVLDCAEFHKGEVSFVDTRVGGVLSAQKAVFGNDVKASFVRARLDAGISIRGSTFGGEADFANVNIGELAQFQGVTFGAKVSFNEAKIVGGAAFCNDPTESLPAATFGAEVDFMGMQVDSDLDFKWVQFICPDRSASFDGAKVGGDLFFVGAEFAGELIFRGIHVGGQVALQGAVFRGRVSFNRSSIGGSILFRAEIPLTSTAAFFQADTEFINLQVSGDADFKGAYFWATDKAAVFDGAAIGGDARFEEVRFAGEASFKGVHVAADAVFDGAQFCGKASFEDAHIDGLASFKGDADKKKPIRFDGEASFDNAHFRGAADFSNVHFAQKANFVGTRFERNVSFCPVQFDQEVDFSAAVAERDAKFDEAVFGGSTSFREAEFHVVYFREDILKSAPAGKKQFQGDIDLRGFTYERIGVAWGDLLEKLNPYDRQPYTQLEAAIRAVGNDRTADDIYYARRRRENKLFWQKTWGQLKETWCLPRELPQVLFDTLQWGLFRYGVRPYRLLGLTLLVLAFGATIFTYPHAVMNQDKDLRGSDPRSLTLKQAVGVSLKQFFPAEIPSGSQWIPTERPIPLFAPIDIPFSAYATFHRSVGWVLVPLGVAALAGLLRRSAKASAKDAD